jgi:tetratricopeptide (TPR) repeat protein
MIGTMATCNEDDPSINLESGSLIVAASKSTSGGRVNEDEGASRPVVLAGGSWADGLVVNKERLEEVLDDTSPTFQSIKACGELLRTARICLSDLLEGAEKLEEGENREQSKADLMEALSSFVRTPACRFYTSFICIDQTVMEVVQDFWDNKFHNASEWTDVEFNAAVIYSFGCQLTFQTRTQRGAGGTEAFIKEANRTNDACLVARPYDATMYVVNGNFLMVQGQWLDAIESLQKAMIIDESDNFGARFTLANIFVNSAAANIENVEDTPEAQSKNIEELTYNLRRYLALAPDCHWHVHRACMLLGTYSAVEKAQGSEELEAIQARHPDFAAEVLACFKRGVIATERYENWVGKEQGDFKFHAKQTSSIVARMSKLGLIDEEPPASAYLCANLGCATDHMSQTLSCCAQCYCVSYCSRPCQLSHWKEGGHKQACKRLKAEREGRLKANPLKFKRPDVTPIQK